jgi:glycosyltransferase 2 family protein
MKGKLVLQYLIFFGLAFFLLWYATKDLNMAQIAANIKRSDKLPLLAVAALGIFSVVVRGFRWQILIEPLGKKPGILNTIFSIFIGYGVNFVTPRLGEVARCGVLSKYEGISVDKLAGTMIAERIFDLICLILVALLTVLLEYSQISEYFNATVIAPLQAKFGQTSVWLLVGIGILALSAAIILWRWLNAQKENGKANKLVSILSNIQDGVGSVFKMKKSGLFILQTAVIWTCYWAMTYLGFKALPETSSLTIGAGFSVLTLGSVGIIATPGGTGAYQLIVAGLLSSVYLIDKEIAGTYGLMSWALQNGILLLGAVAALVIFPLINAKKIAK